MMNPIRILLALVVGVVSMTLAAPQDLPPRPALTPTITPSPRPTLMPATPRPALAAGGTIKLIAHSAPPRAWTVVQWQDASGGWHNVDGWRGAFNKNDQVIWWVGPDDLDTGPFRWLVYSSQDGEMLAASESFYLPPSAGEWVEIELACAAE